MSETKPSNPKDALGVKKLPVHLFPQTAIVAGSMAFLEGAAKYGKYNYRIAGVRASIYIDALERHLFAWTNGEDIDPESGLPHLWKMLACIAVLIDAEACGMLTDDRPPKAPVAEMMSQCAPLIEEVKQRYSHMSPHQYTIHDTPGSQE